MQDFVSAANCYEKLVQSFPEETIYKVYYTQSLYEACMYDEAWAMSMSIVKIPNIETKVKKLQAAIKYGQDDIVAAKNLIDQCPTDDLDTEVNLGCLLYKV